MTTPFDKACQELCTHCREAARMEERGEGGHKLRFRTDTQEWVHDFSRVTQFKHAFCYATPLRIKNG